MYGQLRHFGWALAIKIQFYSKMNNYFHFNPKTSTKNRKQRFWKSKWKEVNIPKRILGSANFANFRFYPQPIKQAQVRHISISRILYKKIINLLKIKSAWAINCHVQPLIQRGLIVIIKQLMCLILFVPTNHTLMAWPINSMQEYS